MTRTRQMHGYTGTAIYRIWVQMIGRCTNKNNKDYKYYGGRGITVCKEWRHDFLRFLSDMGHRPNGCVLDRKDNNKGYSSDNCRWATRKESTRNIRSNKIAKIGNQTMVFRDIEVSLGLSVGSIWHRLKRGWPLTKAISTPKSRIES